MLQEYRKAINPPYSKQNIPVILVTLLLLVGLPILLLSTISSDHYDTRGRAQGPESLPANSSRQSSIGTSVKQEVSNMVMVTSPLQNSTVSTPLEVVASVDASLNTTSVEFWKDTDKVPFSIVYEAPFEAVLTSLRPGQHKLRIKAMTNTGNVYLSEDVTVTVR